MTQQDKQMSALVPGEVPLDQPGFFSQVSVSSAASLEAGLRPPVSPIISINSHHTAPPTAFGETDAQARIGQTDVPARIDSLQSVQSTPSLQLSSLSSLGGLLRDKEFALADLRLLVFSTMALVFVLFAAHVDDVGQPLFFVFSTCIVVLFATYVILRFFKILGSSSFQLVSLLLAYSLCSLISLAAPSRRRELFGLAHTTEDEACEEGTIALWIAFILAFVTVFAPMPRRFLLVFGQLVCLQHLLLGLTLERPECAEAVLPRGGQGSFLLGLPPIWSSSLLLHVLAALFAAMRTHFDPGKRVEASAAGYIEQVSDSRKQKKCPDQWLSESEQEMQLQNWIEKLVLLLSDEEQAGRDFLEQATGGVGDDYAFNQMPGEMRAWTTVVDSLLDVLSHCEKQLKTCPGSNSKWRRDMKTQLQGATQRFDSGVGEFLMESFMTGDTTKMLCGSGRHSGFDAPAATQTSDLVYDRITSNDSTLNRQSISSKESPDGCYHSEGATEPKDGGKQRTPDLEEEDNRSLAPSETTQGTMRSVISTSVRNRYNVGTWSFDALKMELEQGHVLQAVGFEIISKFNMVSRSCLKEFLKTLEKQYVATNSYHSHVHAADMCNAFCYLVSKTEPHALGDLPASTQVAMYLAALGHDVGHFARNNVFLIQTRHALAVTYNDRSVLENHHASTFVSLLSNKFGASNGDSGCCVLGTLSHEQLREARQLMVSLILGTDTQMHLEDLAAFRLRLGASNFDSLASAADRQQTLGLLFRASDIGHSAKSWELHQQWSSRVVHEFHEQGDEEKRLGLKVSPLCEREGFVMSSSQVGFLQFICLPTWKELLRWEDQQLRHSAAPVPRLGPVGSTSTISPLESESESQCSPLSRQVTGSTRKKTINSSLSSVFVDARLRQALSTMSRGSIDASMSNKSSIVGTDRKSSLRSTRSSEESEFPKAQRYLADVLHFCELNAQAWKKQADEITQLNQAKSENSHRKSHESTMVESKSRDSTPKGKLSRLSISENHCTTSSG